VPALLEAHYAVPGVGAVLNALNYRLDAATIAFCLQHGEAKVLITDRELAPIVGPALKKPAARSSWSTSTTRWARRRAPRRDRLRVVARRGRSGFELRGPPERMGFAGAALHLGHHGRSQGRALPTIAARISTRSARAQLRLTPRSVYLWTLPMFHCSGWTYTWAVTAAAPRTCACAGSIRADFPAIERHRVTHLCGAPIVLNMLVHGAEGAEAQIR